MPGISVKRRRVVQKVICSLRAVNIHHGDRSEERFGSKQEVPGQFVTAVRAGQIPEYPARNIPYLFLGLFLIGKGAPHEVDNGIAPVCNPFGAAEGFAVERGIQRIQQE